MSVDVDSITIPRRFNGPPESGNGGYSCGVVAGRVGNPAEVTLRRPPPLDTPMRVEHAADGVVRLLDGDVLVAEGAPATLDLVPPTPPSVEEASAATAHYLGHQTHGFPSCFVCGPERAHGDGLRLFPGPYEPTGERLATPWVPDPSLAGADGRVRDEFVWCALDCPGGWAAIAKWWEGVGAVVGRMTARLIAPVHASEPHVVVGWPIERDGRKSIAGSAIYDAAGDVCAVARSIWFGLVQ